MTTMTTSRGTGFAPSNHVRLVSALARKDIVDGIRHKSTLTVIVISILMVGFYRYFPAIVDGGDAMSVWVYAEGGRDSALVAALERSPALDVRLAKSREGALEQIADSETPELGLVIPADADAMLTPGAPVKLDGYTMRWLSPAQRQEVESLVEEELTLSVGRLVDVRLGGNEVDLHAGGDFFLFSASISLIFVMVMVGISLIPNLMIEERKARTFDVLMVSPATASDVIAGKAVAGVFYGVLGCAVAMIAFRYLIVQWPLAILAAVAGTLFMASIGLVLGSVTQTRSQLQLVAWLVLIPLLLPVVLVFLQGLVPDRAIAVMHYVPTVIVARMYRLSFTVDAGPADYAVPLGVVLAMIVALLALAAWLVRRQDRA